MDPKTQSRLSELWFEGRQKWKISKWFSHFFNIFLSAYLLVVSIEIIIGLGIENITGLGVEIIIGLGVENIMGFMSNNDSGPTYDALSILEA